MAIIAPVTSTPATPAAVPPQAAMPSTVLTFSVSSSGASRPGSGTSEARKADALRRSEEDMEISGESVPEPGGVGR